MVHRHYAAMSGGIDRVRARGLPAKSGSAAPVSSNDGAFASMLAPGENAANAAEAGAMPGLSGAAWLRADDSDHLARSARDKQARTHGRALLQALAALQHAALRGDGDQAQAALARLAATVRDVQEADDPALQVILREISVRAAVELARAEPVPQP